MERQLDDIADTVTERLLGLCGHVYRGLSEDGKRSALYEVVRSLTAAKLSDEALLATDVDPASRRSRCCRSCGCSASRGSRRAPTWRQVRSRAQTNAARLAGGRYVRRP